MAGISENKLPVDQVQGTVGEMVHGAVNTQNRTVTDFFGPFRRGKISYKEHRSHDCRVPCCAALP